MFDDVRLRVAIAERRDEHAGALVDRSRGMDEADWDAVCCGHVPEHTPSATDVRMVVDAACTGGVPLAIVLSERPRADRCDAEVLDHVRGWARQVAHAQGMLAREVSELARRRDDVPENLRGSDPGKLLEFVGCEVAAALRLSQRAAETLVDDATQLTTRLPETHDALLAGQIDYQTARVIMAETAFVEEEHLAAVERAALGRAETGTSGQVRHFLRRAVTQLDSAAARERELAAVAMRHVRRGEVEDGVGDLTARLPVADLDAVWSVLDTRARGLEDDGRSLDEKRADVLVAMITHPEGVGPPAAGTVRLADLVVAANTVAGDDEPGALAGYGPVTAETARELAAGATWRLVEVDDEGRVVSPPGRPHGPSAPSEPPPTEPPPTEPATETCDDSDSTAADLLRQRVRQMLAGAAADAGRPESTPAYRPTAALTEATRATHRRCRFPGCRRRARRCDLDHVHAWRPDGRGGTTCIENLMPLCRFHHRCKHSPGWSVALHPDRSVTWTTPTGHRWKDPPPGVWG